MVVVIRRANESGVFVRARYQDRQKVAQCGFRWVQGSKEWWSGDSSSLVRLRMTFSRVEEFDDEPWIPVHEDWSGHESAAKDGPADLPVPPGLDYLPFQRGGIDYATRKGSCLIADEQGLGKTVQAIGVANSIRPALILVVCPASMKLVWEAEIDKWLDYYADVHVLGAGRPWPRKMGQRAVVILNYDVLKKYREHLHSIEFDLLIADESHMVKNPKAQRTRHLLGFDNQGGVQAKRRLFLSGTPIENRPVELWSILHSLRPEVFDSWDRFVVRFCNARPSQWNERVLDTSGSSNLAELQTVLRTTCMVRRMKAEVLPQLPAKTRIRVPLEVKSKADKEAIRVEKLAFDDIAQSMSRPSADVAEQIEKSIDFRRRMASFRKATARAKLAPSIKFIEDIAENGKVVVFAIHREILAALEDHFGDAGVSINGSVPSESRKDLVDRFQNDPEVRFFFGQYQAAGTGITLTAASSFVAVEYDWRPGIVVQAEDRLHRIGQSDNVTCYHLVVPDSMDDRLLSSLDRKSDVIAQALDS